MLQIWALCGLWGHLHVQDHVGWSRVHVVGHSMGGMIATRLAALAPHRVASLTLVSATAGGTQAIPRSWRALKYGLQVRWESCGDCVADEGGQAHALRPHCAVQLASAKTAECRAKLDLKLHFCPATLDEPVGVLSADACNTCSACHTAPSPAT